MRSILNLFSKKFFLVAMVITFPVMAFAQVSPAPELVMQLLTIVSGIPKIGPMVSTAMYYVGGVSAFFTALVIFVQAVLKIPQVIAQFKGANELADKIEKFSAKVNYYLKYFSIFNAKK